MKTPSILEQLFAPLILAKENREAAIVLIKDLGWTLDETFDLPALAPLSAVFDQLDELRTRVREHDEMKERERAGETLSDAERTEIGHIIEQSIILGETVYSSIQALNNLADGDISNLAAPLNTREFWIEFALDLPEHLILKFLEVYHPRVYALINFGGAIVLEERPNNREARSTLDWVALGRLLTEPENQIRDTYNWGGPLRHESLMERLDFLLEAYGVPSIQYDLPQAIIQDRFGGSAPDNAIALGANLLKQLKIKQFKSSGLFNPSGHLDLILSPVPQSGSTPTGLLLTLQALGEASQSFDLGAGWSASVSVEGDASGLAGLEFQPGGANPAAGMPLGDASVDLTANPDTPIVLFGEAEKTRIELAGFTAGAGFGQGTPPEIIVDAATQGMQLVVAPGDGDSFINEILREIEFAVPAELSALWSSSDGLTLTGGAGFAVTIPINEKIGPLEVFDIDIFGLIGSGGGAIGAGVAGTLGLGPFVLTVDGIGFEIRFIPTERGSGDTRGAVRVEPAFKPPNGIGLELNMAGVRGGGYLDIRPEEGRYDGILYLNVLEVLEIRAIGMVATRMPDGSDGWSLYLSVTMNFRPGIPLPPLPISITGMGGLGAVNRGLDIDALGDGIRAGSLDAVLFPTDPIGQAPMILSALDDFFPPRHGQYVFGPILELTIGPENLVRIQLGLAVQLPDPITITLLGSVIVQVPPVAPPYDPSVTPFPPPANTDSAKIIDLRFDVAGTLWPTEGKLAVDASISKGKIAFLTIDGDVAIRSDFGSRSPSFLHANGGFHPQFTPPESFPNLDRLAVLVFNEDKLRLGFECYLAYGIPTIQFGASAFFWAKAVGLSAEGRFEFDTLIYFSPFGFTASLGFQVSIKAGSKDLFQVTLRATLKGPKPMLVTGYAEFRALGAKKKFRVEMTIGRAIANGPRETFELRAKMLEELRKPGNWSGAPAEAEILNAVTYDAGDQPVLVHPAGRIQITQSIAPLGIEIEKYGEDKVRNTEANLALTDARIGGQTAVTEDVDDWFTPGLYFDMKEDELVSAPSFDKMPAGLSLAGAAPSFASPDPYLMEFETEIIDPDLEADQPAEGADIVAHLKDGRALAEAARKPLGVATGLDLKSTKGAPRYGISPLEHSLRDATTGAALGNSPSFGAALSQSRKAAKNGQRVTVQPVYERKLKGGAHGR